MGIRGFSTTSWSHDTLNCTDRSQPMNAWGMGLPQAQLERIKSDPTIMALALQEAWNCGAPQNVNGVLGFKTASRDRNGTALLARHGFAGPVQYHEIDARARQWLIGGDVCLEAGCANTMPIYSVHFADTTEDGVPIQAQRVLEFLARRGGARIFMGDLNVHKTDTWNPKVRCTARDKPGALRTIGMIEGAGYTDAWKATQNSEGWTGMASRPGCGSPAGNLYKRIDYVYSSGLQTVSTDRFARAAPGGDAPSDHVGLIAELLIVPAGAPPGEPAP
ncbi:MAG: endonuclease/exonuclease/phosphatase family protein [Acidobacteriota bacterium]|nr:endonuclease/exonuclease/phosphatase family protein [Acidobacteriota bacterium]